ncbi:MAG: hypothetical protein KF753_05120 [Caldilineaceae bacterium]|nr:hypothetical protein [Caldilineaceae bacterium]
MTYRAIADAMGLPEATVRGWLNSKPKRRSPDEPAQVIFNAICWFKRHNDGNAPTRAELAELTGYGNGHIAFLCKLLEKRGWIKSLGTGSAARKIEVVGGQWLPPARWRETANPPRRATTRPRLRRAQRETLAKAGLLCECERGEIRWVKMIQQGKRKPEPMYLCDVCADDERDASGESELKPYKGC